MDFLGFQLPTILGFQVPKLFIVILMGVAGYYIAIFIMRVGMSGMGKMFMMGRDVSGPRPGRASSSAAGSGPAVAFERGVVVASGADWDEIQTVNAALEQLQARKKPVLPRQGALQASRGAWLGALFEQAILHRVLTLASGTITLWEVKNPFGAALSARSLLETGAVVLQMERQLSLLAAGGRLADVDAYVAERAFVGQPGGWIEQARQTRAVDLPLAIDEADRIIPGARFCYDRLSEIVSPEAVGQHAVFGAIDKTGTSAEFREEESLDPSTFRLILDAARIVVPVAAALEAIESLAARLVSVEKV
jgi:hypothetical protein